MGSVVPNPQAYTCAFVNSHAIKREGGAALFELRAAEVAALKDAGRKVAIDKPGALKTDVREGALPEADPSQFLTLETLIDEEGIMAVAS